MEIYPKLWGQKYQYLGEATRVNERDDFWDKAGNLG